MIDDDLADTAELELMDTDVMEQLPDTAAKTSAMNDGLAGNSVATDEELKESRAKPGFDPYNHS